jgi:hypothetical protein
VHLLARSAHASGRVDLQEAFAFEPAPHGRQRPGARLERGAAGRQPPALQFTFADSNQNIPSVSGLIYSTVFANGTLIGSLPGYYNSGNGVTVNFTPTKSFYVNLGVYDGNNARRIQTGMVPPSFNGYYGRANSTCTGFSLAPVFSSRKEVTSAR